VRNSKTRNAIALEARDAIGALVADKDLPVAEQHGQIFAGDFWRLR
jgi:hypothetical protein